MLLNELQHTIKSVEQGCDDIFALKLCNLVKQMITKVQKQEIALAIANSYMTAAQASTFKQHYEGIVLLMHSWETQAVKKLTQNNPMSVISGCTPQEIVDMVLPSLSNRADMLLDSKIPLEDVVDLAKLKLHVIARMKSTLTLEEKEYVEQTV